MLGQDETRAETDDRLLARAGEGDQRAFAELVTRHTERARALALRFTGNGADADEVVQHAFWAAWRAAGGWQAGRARFSTWLHRVVVNRCIDKSRRKKLRNWLPLGDADAVAGDSEPDPGQALDARRRLAAVRGDILELPPRQRAVLLLSVMQERGNKEIAEIMGMTVGAVEQALVRARRSLRDRMARREAGSEEYGHDTEV